MKTGYPISMISPAMMSRNCTPQNGVSILEWIKSIFPEDVFSTILVSFEAMIYFFL